MAAGCSTDSITESSILVRIRDSHGQQLRVKVLRTDALRRVMNVYSERLGTPANQPGDPYVIFEFDGCEILPTDTPDKLLMRDGNTIFATPL